MSGLHLTKEFLNLTSIPLISKLIELSENNRNLRVFLSLLSLLNGVGKD